MRIPCGRSVSEAKTALRLQTGKGVARSLLLRKELNMTPELRALDPAKVKAGGERIFGYLKGMGVSAMIYLGDKLGLYQALDGAGLVTSAELAHKTGLHERWVREWIRGQAAAGIIDYKGDDRFELSPEIAVFLADSNS